MKPVPDGSNWSKLLDQKTPVVGALAVASAIILYLSSNGIPFISEAPRWILAIVAIVGIVSACLTAAHPLSAT